MPTNRALAGNYYEELGIGENASQSEVRDAFRAMVRLLHPDHQTDPDLKAIAELQMRRLNAIYSVLSDPEKRREYDARLDEAPVQGKVFNPASNIDPRRFLSRFLWVGALTLLGGICLWMFVAGFGDSGSAPPADRSTGLVRAAAPPPAAHAETALAEPPDAASLESALRTMRAERDTARYELAKLRAERAAEDAERHASTMQAPMTLPSPPSTDPVPLAKLSPPGRSLSANVLPVAPRPGPRPLGADPHQFAGFWFFAETGKRESKNLYPPEFIEATLTERNGVIHGAYRSRYEIVDRAISPDVNFEFSGSANGATITTPWTGPGGAKGVVTLTLTSENSLKFDWRASDVGSIQGLASGTATLTRRID
ncbi:MAG: DnaJ domain-containing protein [Acidobacteriota bacterium]|nr:DnaJ domain-containing protein [Acidobacteriota bacterium]